VTDRDRKPPDLLRSTRTGFWGRPETTDCGHFAIWYQAAYDGALNLILGCDCDARQFVRHFGTGNQSSAGRGVLCDRRLVWPIRVQPESR